MNISAGKIVDQSKAPDREELITEVNFLRSLVSDLSEQREDDRKSILILQSQIDNLRDAKCSDSFESSFSTMSAICSSLWNKVPTIQLEGIIHYLSQRSRRKKGKTSSKSSVSSSLKRKSLRMTNENCNRSSEASIFQLNKGLPRGS